MKKKKQNIQLVQCRRSTQHINIAGYGDSYSNPKGLMYFTENGISLSLGLFLTYTHTGLPTIKSIL